MSEPRRPRPARSLATYAAALVLAIVAGAGRADVVRERALPLDWRADTPQTREQGLMFVPQMDASQAMFFVYEPPARVAMWMKNTLIPLDMLFVDAGGCVIMVRRDARPGSLDLIRSPDAVALVVELAGGTATRYGIATGARVSRPTAGWPTRPLPCPLVH
jgi:uncharacterized protein